MPNELIIANLYILANEAKASHDPPASGRRGKDRFRAIAYAKAIKAIKALPADLTSGKEALDLKIGIGAKIAKKIQEILDTGELNEVQALGNETITKTMTLALFGKIWGVGPVKASQLWDAGARTIDDLRTTYFNLLTANQKIGLKYMGDLEKRLPKSEVLKIVFAIETEIRKLSGLKIEHRFCGSFRRRLPTAGDIDLLLSSDAESSQILPALVKRLTKSGILLESLALGLAKYMGIIKTDTIAFRIDIEFIKPAEWPFALFYFTGPGSFNEKVRTIAKKKGLRLSEHGLLVVATNTYVSGLKTESDIFEYLGMEYLPPWERAEK